MSTQTIDRAIGEYVGRCVEHLRDLPESDRSSILDDIRQILTEVTAELEGAPDDLLGPPDRFVNELRGAAGLQTGEPAPPINRVTVQGLIEWAARLRSHRATQWLSALARDLRPAWWVGRGLLLAGVLAQTTSLEAWRWTGGILPLPAVFDSRVLGWVTMAVGIFGSVQLGRKAIGWRRLAGVAATLVAVLAFVAFASTVKNSYPTVLTGDHPFTDVTYAGPPETTAPPPLDIVDGMAVLIGTDAGMQETVYSPDGAEAVYGGFLAAGVAPGSIWVELDGQRSYPGSVDAFYQILANRFR